MNALILHLVVIACAAAFAPNGMDIEGLFGTSAVAGGGNPMHHHAPLIVPKIVHQTYDYQSPNFFLYLSFVCIQRYIQPDRHILWVNDEGRYRKGQWQSWQQKAVPNSWEHNLTQLINHGKIEVKFLTFPAHPPGNTSTFAPNKAHRSDFVRLEALTTIGGIYLDTDAFAIANMRELRVHNFTMSFDNIVNPDKSAPKRLNNGVMLASPHSQFLHLWAKKYAAFNPESFDHDSSVSPYLLLTQFPDLVHLEMSRIAPISFAFQTARIAEALTCGIYVPPTPTNAQRSAASPAESRGAIWAPRYDGKAYTYADTRPDEYMFAAIERKFVLHLTMSQVRGTCMMRKNLGGPQDLDKLPSLLGRIFRIALYGRDHFNYAALVGATVDTKLAAWKSCRDAMGMYAVPERDVSTLDDGSTRQQYVRERWTY